MTIIPKHIQVNLDKLTYIHLQFTDILGHAKSMAIPVKRLEEALSQGIVFDGSAVLGFVRVQQSDMLLIPDPDSWLFIQELSYARLLCDIHLPDGSKFPGCPRNCLRQMENSLPYPLDIGVEMEFFLFKRDENKPTPVDRAYYFDLHSPDPGKPVRKDLARILEQGKIPVLTSHHENSPGQQELSLGSTTALKLSDNIITFKFLAREIAHNHGFLASFMPKPLPGVNGSGMHFNFSIPQHKDKQEYFMAGILKFAAEFTAVTNPLVNSYKRLIPGFEAPIAAVWARANRSPLIRVPGIGSSFELRSPDSACNPYLALTVILAAGKFGLNKELVLPPPVEQNIYLASPPEILAQGHQPLPPSLNHAINLMEQSSLVKDSLGEHIFTNYLNAKKLEWHRYRKQIHQWEIDQYMEKS